MRGKLVYTFTVLFAAATMICAGAMPTEVSADNLQACEEEAYRYSPNEVDLYFPSYPTTGYGWVAEPEDSEIVSIRDKLFEDSSELGFVGTGGTHWFHIKGEKPGTTSVSFRYIRPWEPDKAAESTLFRLSVNEQLDVLIWGVEVE